MALTSLRNCRVALGLCYLIGIVQPAFAQFGPRIMDAVDVTTTDTHVEVVLLFNCQVRYLSHLPREEGDALDVRFTLGPDCRLNSGLVASETMAGPAGDPVLKGIDLTPLLADDVDVRFNWQRRERFLVVPTSDQRGLRIRLLRGDRDAEQSRVIITEAEGDLVTGFAINLESSRTPFSAQFVTEAEKALGLKSYTSEAVIDGQQWYRLRLGPFPTRAEADRQLLRAQARYPRAWLAIGDEVLHDTGDTSRTVAQSTDAAVDRSGLTAAPAGLLSAAQSQMRQKQYETAIASLTRYLETATGDDRATALELLGLARERNGQLAHAKAEYEAYLREYQIGRGADRVRRRLNALRTAGGISRTGDDPDTDPELAWRFFGGASQYYRMDDNQRTTGDTTAQFTSQNALLTDFDLVARRRGINFDSIVRVNAGYLKDLLTNGPGDKVRVSSAFIELGDVETGWLARAGRQSRSSEGLLGTFDGIFGSYRWLPHLTFNGAVGFPVESTRSGFNTDRQFTSLAANFGIFDRAWEPALYVVNQMYDGETDRQAVGVEVRYFRPGRTFVGFADYDLHFQELNSAVLVGTMQLPGQWSMSLDLEQRKSPVLTTRNALIGQPVPTLADLLSLFSSDEIQQLALDRTSPTEIYGMSSVATTGGAVAVHAECVKHHDWRYRSFGRCGRIPRYGSGPCLVGTVAGNESVPCR